MLPKTLLTRLTASLDPFLLMLLGTMALATLLPARGVWTGVVEWAANAGIVLLFFLHGARLSRKAILGALGNGRLHVAVLVTTFVLFPLIGLALSKLPGVPPQVATGLLFTALLPSTVQSSIAFTSMAGGNVAAAVCSASLSNLVGVFATPLLVAIFMRTGGAPSVSMESVKTLMLLLLLPFVAGHLLRPWIGTFVARNSAWLGKVDRGSILMVVYAAFGAAVVGGLWDAMSWRDFGWIMGLSCVLLVLMLGLTWFAAKRLRMPREDAIVLLFCGSKKSLATGVPMAGVLFPAAIVGPILLPLMIFHQIQLMACAVIARRMGNAASGPGASRGATVEAERV